MSLWDQIRDALRTVWADWRDAREDERTRLISELTAAWRAEQRLTVQVRQIIPAIPYEQFRRRLDAIARDDEQHATLVQERLRVLGGMVGDDLKTNEQSASSMRSGPWHRLQQVLREKRELYERYHQEANRFDDVSLQLLLKKLRDEEERHQDELIGMLIHLDAHVHEIIN